MSERAQSQTATGNGQHHAVCPLCTRVVSKDTEGEAASVAESHNESRHGGDEVAQVVGPYREDLDEFMDAVKEKHGSDVYGEIGARIVDVDPWGVINV